MDETQLFFKWNGERTTELEADCIVRYPSKKRKQELLNESEHSLKEFEQFEQFRHLVKQLDGVVMFCNHHDFGAMVFEHIYPTEKSDDWWKINYDAVGIDSALKNMKNFYKKNIDTIILLRVNNFVETFSSSMSFPFINNVCFSCCKFNYNLNLSRIFPNLRGLSIEKGFMSSQIWLPKSIYRFYMSETITSSVYPLPKFTFSDQFGDLYINCKNIIFNINMRRGLLHDSGRVVNALFKNLYEFVPTSEVSIGIDEVEQLKMNSAMLVKMWKKKDTEIIYNRNWFNLGCIQMLENGWWDCVVKDNIKKALDRLNTFKNDGYKSEINAFLNEQHIVEKYDFFVYRISRNSIDFQIAP